MARWGSSLHKLSSYSELLGKPVLSVQDEVSGIFLPVDEPKPTRQPSGHVKGLINLGNTCFLNAVIQSVDALPSISDFLHDASSVVPAKGTTASFAAVLKDVHSATGSAVNPSSLIYAMTGTRTLNKTQQDAHEMFQALSTAFAEETRPMPDHSFASTPMLARPRPSLLCKTISRAVVGNDCSNIPRVKLTPFESLVATQVHCQTCGYKSVLRPVTVDNFSLPLSEQPSCRLDDLLDSYFGPERLHDYVCPRCTLLATKAHLQADIKNLEQQLTVSPSSKLRHQLEDMRRTLQTISDALKHNKYDDDLLKQPQIKKVKPHRVYKQLVLCKPPTALCIHLSRLNYGYRGLWKNPIHVDFSARLDFGKYDKLFASKVPAQRGSYELVSVIVHIGGPNSGHFMTYRRVPNRSLPPGEVSAPLQSKLHGIEPSPVLSPKLNARSGKSLLTKSGLLGQATPSLTSSMTSTVADTHRWLCISDETVRSVSPFEVFGAEAYMLFYERSR